MPICCSSPPCSPSQPSTEWDGAVASGQYAGNAMDRADGFIHLSTMAQAAETAAKYFQGQSMLLLHVHPERWVYYWCCATKT